MCVVGRCRNKSAKKRGEQPITHTHAHTHTPSPPQNHRVMGGRKAFHGARELLASDHADSASLATVLSKARVLPLSDYLASLPAADGDGGATALPPDLFYTRYRFLVAKVKGGEERPARFEPDRVPVVCACALPFNPDQHYIKCGQCGDACHPGCVGLAPRARQPEGWVCPTCVAGAGAANGGVRAGEATAGGPQTQA